MKKIQNLFTLLIPLVIGTSFIACSSDDDDSTSVSESPEDNLPEGAKAFVGYWDDASTTISAIDFIFFTDGTGEMWHDYSDALYNGYWTFDSNTSILATTMNSWQFQVTLSNDEAWTGVSLGSSTAKTFNRGSNVNMAKMLLRGTSWSEADTLTLTFPKKITHYDAYLSGTILPKLPSSSSVSYYGYVLFSLSEDDNTDDYTFKYSISYRYYRYKGTHNESTGYNTTKAGSGTITIENPYTPSKTKITLTGFLEGTMNKVNDD